MLVFVSGVCGLFVVAFLFFRFRFFHTYIFLALPFFLTLPISPSPPLPHIPHSRESGNLPVMPAEGGGFAPSALDREIPAFAGMGRGFCWFLCWVFADSLLSRFCFFASVFFSHLHFSRTSIFSHTLHFALTPTPPHPPFPRKRESPCDCPPKAGDSRLRRWIGRFPLSREWKSGGGMEKWAGMERGGNGKGWGMEKGREWKRGGNGKRGRKWTGEREWKRGREKDTFFARNRAKGKKNIVWL